MKGEEGSERVICIKNEDGVFVEEIVKLNDCGGLGCCRFEFKDAPAEEWLINNINKWLFLSDEQFKKF